MCLYNKPMITQTIDTYEWMGRVDSDTTTGGINIHVPDVYMMTTSNGNISCYWPFVREIHPSPVDFPHKGQWCGALVFSLFYAWTNGWANNRGTGHVAHYDVTVMSSAMLSPSWSSRQWVRYIHSSNKELPQWHQDVINHHPGHPHDLQNRKLKDI